MSVEHCWNETEKGKTKVLGAKPVLMQLHSPKFHMDWLGVDVVSPWLKDGK
jgi:hypothetical protein